MAGTGPWMAGMFVLLSKHCFGRENRTFEPLPLVSLLEASLCFSLDALRVLSKKRISPNIKSGFSREKEPIGYIYIDLHKENLL